MTQYNATLLWFIKEHPEYKKVLKYLFNEAPEWCPVPKIKSIFNLDNTTWKKFSSAAATKHGSGFIETSSDNYRAVVRAKPIQMVGLNSFLEKVKDI